MPKKYNNVFNRTERFRVKEIKKDATLSIDYWHKRGTSESELLAVHKKLAKRANQRLVRLERAVSEVTNESFDTFGAADIAKEYLKAKGATGKLRFTENAKINYLLPEDKQTNGQVYDRLEILKDIKKMQDFLLSPSSTVKEQKAIEQARIETFEKAKYVDGQVVREPIKFANNKEFYDFLNSETYKELATSFNSDTIVESYDAARGEGKSHTEIVDALEDYRKTTNQDRKGLRASLGLKEVE